MQLQLKYNKQHDFFGKLENIYCEYKSCVRDVETIVFAIECHRVDDIRSLLSGDNSQEMQDIVSTTINRYEDDLQGFVKQIISLRFNDMEIPDYAGEIRKVLDAFDKNENTLYTRLRAVMGNADAQNALGEYYYNQKRFKKAFSWYKKSAEQGFAQAQCQLGYCYHKGYGCDQDDCKAFEWYTKSTEQGYAPAQLNLGCCYDEGKGCDQDYNKAFEWYKKSAEQGYAPAQYNLGCSYHEGKGCDQDYNKAFEWYKKSAEQGYAPGQHNLGCSYERGDGCDQDYNQAFHWYKKSAVQDHAPAQCAFGGCYHKGYGCEQNDYKAFDWLKKSAEQGYALAQSNLGCFYEKGYGCDQNDCKAFEWYKKSAEQGFAQAQFNLGLCYYEGQGCDQDYNQAFHWFTRASQDMEDTDTYSGSIYMIGVMYYDGKIGFGDKFTAVNYYKISAGCGDDFAQYELGHCYEKGIGVKEMDIEKAKYWYGEAAKQGHTKAIESLKRLEESE